MRALRSLLLSSVNRKCSIYIKIPQYKTLLLIWWKLQLFAQKRDSPLSWACYHKFLLVVKIKHRAAGFYMTQCVNKNWTLFSGTISFHIQGMSHRCSANTVSMSWTCLPLHPSDWKWGKNSYCTLLPILISSFLLGLFPVRNCEFLSYCC